MQLTLIFTGRTKNSYLEEGIEDYFKRIKRYISFEIKGIPAAKITKNMTEKEVAIKEGREIMKNIKKDSIVVLLDEGGKEYSSDKFAEWLVNIFNSSKRQLVFIIGGAYGFSDDVKQRADASISLSRMTFSHQLVRLIFLEQLYRAFTIINHEPYHHGA
ncbi:MAG: 23S rRNA (pseudouridine(1915)-N(3))-methyltransferase RlmH [Bacteroidales bacterium]